MLYTDMPPRFPVPFANSATGTYKRTVPTTSADPVAASLTLGFPPDTFGPTGTPPDGRDMNGILAPITAWSRWQAAGGPVFYDSTFSTAVGGYPKYTVLSSTTLGYFWQSNVDSNTVDPDAGASANWTRLAPALPSVGGPGTNYRISTDGFIEQWGVVAIGAGTNSYVTSFSFPIPFVTEVHGPWGNCDNGANGSWKPVAVMFPSTTLTGSGLIADTTDGGQTFASGRYVRWTAHGY